MARQGVKTEVSIKDLNSLRVQHHNNRSGSRNNNSKNFDDNTLRTSSTMESSLSNSQNFFDANNNSAKSNRSNKSNPNNRSYNYGHNSSSKGNNCNNSSKRDRSFHWSGKSLNMEDSCNSSFSDLAKERSLDFSRESFESSSSYDPNFNVSASSLDWDEKDAFPKSKRSPDTASTTSSTVDMSEFVVLSAFSVDTSEANEDDFNYDDHDDDYDYDDEDVQYGDDEDGDYYEDPQEEDDEEESCSEDDGEVDEDLQSQAVVVPPPPTDSARRGDRRASLQREAEEKQRQAQAEKAALCQHLARSGIDNSSARGRGRQRNKTGPRAGSAARSESVASQRSAMTENDAAALKARRRSISRQRDRAHRSLSRQRTPRDRSVSRDRSTATAPANSLEITLDKPLLGKSHAEESDEEEDPWSCPWFNRSISTQNAIADAPAKEMDVRRKSSVRIKESDAVPTSMLDTMMDCSASSSRFNNSRSSRSSRCSTKEGRHLQRAHSSDEPAAHTRERREAKRRSVRETKSAGEGRMRRPNSSNASTSTSTKRLSRSSMKDDSHRSAPGGERRRISLEDRLAHMKDISSRSTPETRTHHTEGQDHDERSRGSASINHERKKASFTKQRVPSDVKPTRPRRTRSTKTTPISPFEQD